MGSEHRARALQDTLGASANDPGRFAAEVRCELVVVSDSMVGGGPRGRGLAPTWANARPAVEELRRRQQACPCRNALPDRLDFRGDAAGGRRREPGRARGNGAGPLGRCGELSYGVHRDLLRVLNIGAPPSCRTQWAPRCASWGKTAAELRCVLAVDSDYMRAAANGARGLPRVGRRLAVSAGAAGLPFRACPRLNTHRVSGWLRRTGRARGAGPPRYRRVSSYGA